MATNRKAYGIGCITIKRTNPGSDSGYVYAEWSVNGRRHTKSCGNADRPQSRQRAKDILRGALQDRIAALEEELGRLRAMKPDQQE